MGKAIHREQYEQERVQLFYPAAMLALGFAAALLTAYIALDHILFPDVADVLLRMRLLFVAALIPMAMTARTAAARAHPHAIGLAGATALGAMIDLMVWQTGGAMSPYYAGNNLVLLGVATLFPWSAPWTLAASSILVGMYALAAWPADAGEVPAFVNAVTFMSSMGLVGVVSSAIGERMRVKEFTLRRDRERVAQAKDEFMASVSHDLRTPLNVVLGYSDLLIEGEFGPLNGEQKATIDRIVASARGQLVLVNDLLDLARIEQGKVSCVLEPVSVSKLMPDLSDMMRILLTDKDVKFQSHVDPGLVVLADEERLKQVLVNLLTNAAKFTEQGFIRLFADGIGELVELRIVDSGPGIDPSALQSTLFEKSPSAGFEGSAKSEASRGFGLTIVTRLVDLMDGTFDIQSRRGSGTRARITLPAVARGAGMMDRNDGSGAESSNGMGPRTEPAMRRVASVA